MSVTDIEKERQNAVADILGKHVLDQDNIEAFDHEPADSDDYTTESDGDFSETSSTSSGFTSDSNNDEEEPLSTTSDNVSKRQKNK